MVRQEKILAILKYIGCFLLCNVLLGLVMLLIATLDQEKLELTECFLFEAGRIKETFDYQGYLQGYCYYPRICACVATSEWILFFYIWSLPIFVFYEVFRRKIIPIQYAYLFVLGEIAFWSMLCFFSQDNIPYKWFAVDNTYKFAAPLAIILLTLHSLPPKVLRVLSIIIGIIYGLYVGFWGVIILSNLLKLW